MKTIFQYGNNCIANITSKYFLIISILLFSFGNGFGQIKPNIIWNIEDDNSNQIDWSLDQKATPDGGFVGVGYTTTDATYGTVMPYIYKLDANGTVDWKINTNIHTLNSGTGQLNEVIINSAGNYVAIGMQKPTGAATHHCLLVEYQPNGTYVNSRTFLVSFTGTPTTTTTQGRGIKEVPTAIDPNGGYVFCGRTDGAGSTTWKPYIAKVDVTFNTINWKFYFSTNEGQLTSIAIVPNTGFVAAGYLNNGTNEDVLVVRTNSSGVLSWTNTINSSNAKDVTCLSYVKEDFNTGPCSVTANSKDRAEDIIVASDGVYVISALFNLNSTGCSGNTYYKDADGVLIRMFDNFVICSGVSTSVLQIKNIAHFSGEDFKFQVVEDFDNKFVTIASTVDNAVVGSSIKNAYLIKTNLLTKTVLWKKNFTQNGNDFCAFGLDKTLDGGYAVSGNNAVAFDNITAARLSGDCNGSVATPSIPITSNTTWSTNMIINGQVNITSGTLTINSGAVIKFASECSGINVIGGALTISNATLTRAGNEDFLWKGIKVIGGSTISFNNGAIVEHAQVGLDCYNQLSGINFYSPLLSIWSSTFKNNQKGIRKNGANWDPWSDIIAGTNFITDANVSSKVVSPVRYVELINSDKMQIAKIPFGGAATTFTDNTGLDVQAVNKQGVNQLQVLDAIFNSIDKGIYIQGSSASDRVLRNTFNTIPVVNLFGDPGYDATKNYGVYLVGTSKVRLEANTITGTSRSGSGKIYGILADNTTNDGALIFKNTMSNTGYGFQSQNNNSNLAMSCNTFSGYSYNLFYGPSWFTASGSMRQQGNNSCINSADRAGNEWTSLCTGSNVVDISVVSGSYFTYYTHTKDLGGATEKVKPNCSTTGWENPTYLKECSFGQPGYEKTSTACNTPFYTCTGCRLSMNDLGIDPQLVKAKNYYRDLADGYRNQFAQNNKDKAIKEFLANYGGYEQLVSNEIIGQLLSRNLDTAILYLENSDLLEDKKLLAELYLHSGRFAECGKTLSDISQRNNGIITPVHLSVDDEAAYPDENNDFVLLINLVLSVFNSGRDMSQLTISELTELERLSSSNLAVGAKACAYLKQAIGKECDYEVLQYIPENNIDAQKRIAAPEEGFYVNLYPNPTNNLITLKANITDEIVQPHYYVYDLAGNILLSGILQSGLNEVIIETKEFAEGLYILQLRNMNATIQARQFAVFK